jgi:Uma2 family endonuclease
MPTLEKTIDTSTPVKLVYHATVHDLPSDERPRERLQHYGPQALSNAELLAIILRTGNTRDNVLELAGKLLHWVYSNVYPSTLFVVPGSSPDAS